MLKTNTLQLVQYLISNQIKKYISYSYSLRYHQFATAPIYCMLCGTIDTYP